MESEGVRLRGGLPIQRWAHDTHTLSKGLFDDHVEIEDIDLMVESKGERRKGARDLYAAWGAPGPSAKPASRRIFRPKRGEEYRSGLHNIQIHV